MREILFRGKRKSGPWCYGDLLNYDDVHKTIINKEDECIVIPETIGQYTGLKDKNGKMIFEGDICSVFLESRENVEALVEFKDGRFILKYPIIDIDSGGLSLALIRYTINHSVEVIGNIHDNPELLK
jgi:uncharacterized phage protein (TIGR01671 family)